MSRERPRRVYRETDHTADLRVEIYGRTEHELMDHAVEALYDLLGLRASPEDSPEPCSPLDQVAVSGVDREDLLVRFLGELLAAATVDRRRWVPRRGSCRLTRQGAAHDLRMEGRWQTLPEKATHWKREIKAVTYHDARIQEHPEGYVATLVMDL